MKLQIPMSNNNLDMNNLSCDAGKIEITWIDAQGKTWIQIDVHPDKQDAIKKLLFNKHPDCIFCGE